CAAAVARPRLRLPPAAAATPGTGVVALVASRLRGEVDEEVVVIERRGFVRDSCFLLVALCYLLAVLLASAVTVWVAASFLSHYAAYVLLVSLSHFCAAAGDDADTEDLLLPVDKKAVFTASTVESAPPSPTRNLTSGSLLLAS
ncbi:unnamed protein product, partial [Urochloa humidicola]